MMSSCSSEKLWTSSTATAPGTADVGIGADGLGGEHGERRADALAAAVGRSAVGLDVAEVVLGGAAQVGVQPLQRGDEHRVDEPSRTGEHVGRDARGTAGVRAFIHARTSSGVGDSGGTPLPPMTASAAATPLRTAPFHRRRPAGVGPRSGDVEAGNAR